MLRHLDALLLAMDTSHILIISGRGDVIEPDEPVAAIGSGGNYALAAAKALLRNTDLPPEGVVEESLKIASEICIYTNQQLTLEKL